MNSSQATKATMVKVGIFTLAGLLLIGAATVFVNDKPFWWRPCQLVQINVEDATGLKTKSPVRSLGLEIGYLHSVQLAETHVSLGICITAPIEVLPSTRAYIRGEGFLGDKFVELKPVRYLGAEGTASGKHDSSAPAPASVSILRVVDGMLAALETAAMAAPATGAEPAPKRAARGEREIPVGETSQDVQQLVNRVDELVNQMTGLTNNLKQAINPDQLRQTMKELNSTLANASRTLAPEGGLNQTAQRTLAKLEDAVEQLRDMMTRVNNGEGSVGMLLNDPTYAEEIKLAIRNINKLLGKAQGLRFAVDIGGERMQAFSGDRGWFRIALWPDPTRYYLLGISVDARGSRKAITTSTTVGSQTVETHVEQIEQTGLLLTAMVGKVFWNRIDLSIGALHNDGAISGALWLGPNGMEDRIQLRNDIYSRGGSVGMQDRLNLIVRPYKSIYFKGGLETFNKVDGRVAWTYGAGISFDDDDIKLLFALRP